MFAVEEDVVNHIKGLPQEERADYISDELEEIWFAEHRDRVYELDKSWDAMHRVLTDGNLFYCGNDHFPLGGVILGGEVLYGDEEDEDDYIITCTPPDQVRAIFGALSDFSEAQCRNQYFTIDPEVYGLPLTNEDFDYTWQYLEGSVGFWRRAAEQGLYVLFTADQ
ncbi:YfbM family protein [Desulfosarcina sp. OttesenSCG-928-G10]|nr:YfbM family protein [Desulfosarcina sp. OttesenSCG-928-G10]